MAVILPTVKIKATNAHGFALINETEFDEAVHERWTGEEPAPGGLEEKTGFDLAEVVQDPALENLIAAGFNSALTIHAADMAQLVAVDNVGNRTAEKLKAYAAGFVVEVPAG